MLHVPYCPTYSDEIAVLMAKCSQIAYEHVLLKIREKLNELDLQLRKFHPGEPQYFIAEHRDFYILSFRGTKGVSDKFTNLLFRRTKTAIGKMHQIYKEAYCDIHSDLEGFFKKELKREKFIYITGHSRGGALAILATSQLIEQKIAACYTFGTPPISEEKLNCYITKPIYRFVNDGDIIPSLLEFKYDHVGSVYFLTKDNCLHRSPHIGYFKKGLMFSKRVGVALKNIFIGGKSKFSHPEHEIKTYIKKLEKLIHKRQKVMKGPHQLICRP